jgi:integrase
VAELRSADAPVMTWERALEAWRLKLQSDATRTTYASAVRRFFTTPGAPDLAALDIDALDAYAGAQRLHASKDAPPAERLAPATVNLRLAALRSFLGFCRRRGWLTPGLGAEQISDALEGLRARVQRPYQVVEGDEVSDLLDAAAADAYDPARAVALLALGLGAGLRVAELVALDVGDLATSSGVGCYVDARAGKGRKDRQVPISQDVYELVLAYLTATDRAVHRTADRGTPVFLSRKCLSGDGRLTTRQARRIVAAIAGRAGIAAKGKRITPHALRHSYALRVLLGDLEAGQAPAPLPAVSMLLGHSSVAVTGRYLAHFEQQKLAAFAPALRRRVVS